MGLSWQGSSWQGLIGANKYAAKQTRNQRELDKNACACGAYETIAYSGCQTLTPVLLHLPEILNRPGRRYQWGRLYGASYGLLLGRLAQSADAPLLVVAAGNEQADELLDQLEFFRPEGLSVRHFPDWETLPYDVFSPHQDITAKRLETLAQLPRLERGVLIATTGALLQRLAPPAYIQSQTLTLKQGDTLDPGAFKAQLISAGYYAVEQVVQHGEFAARGSLIDLFPAGTDAPYRIDLLDDEIESIRAFDPESQRSTNAVDGIRLLPAREFPLDEEGISRFRRQFRRCFAGNPKNCPLYNDISDGTLSPGAEYYLPLFFEQTATVFDYLPANTIIATLDAALDEAEPFYAQVEERYESRRDDAERPVLPPRQIYLNADDLRRAVAERARIDLRRYAYEAETPLIGNFNTAPIGEVHINARAERPAGPLQDFIDNFDGNVLLAAETAGQRELLLETLRGFGLYPAARKGWRDFLDNPAPLAITVGPIATGMILRDGNTAIITDAQILGRRTRQVSARRRRKDAGRVFNDLAELRVGSPVTHETHGVGRYIGLQTLQVNGYAQEFLTLQYADDNKLYVPVSSLHLISRYTGGAEESAPLHRLGGEQWAKAKRKAAEKARDAAVELLDIYARREARPGYSYPVDEAEYAAFAAGFAFEETEDQQNAIDAVIADMRGSRPMDRVVCGDVGFGKTEVAMRAAFVAAQCGKQVAVLCPTTLLTQQHFQNFRDRFADWPVKVEALSRFRGKKETKAITERIGSGNADIVIGTHKLLQQDVRFHDLGLLIIDEEHRFGVRHKEQIKKLRSHVDMLTLTATPIPRTLNMSLAGLRDLSIIATPPMQRLSIKTFVSEWRDHLAQEACLREIKRGGQVYFLRNDVRGIEQAADEVRKLLPQARVATAHGQMHERALEQVMLDFYHRKYNILVCSTIIESGIDVPTANTIIINRADKLGLAQLHQLRGRVGRSHHQAYAYLITPPRKAMSADAIKRIEAVESMEDLGAGFTLASHDLEIRGAGELLGEEQSGQIAEVGYAMYTDLLRRAVDALKCGKIPGLEQPLHSSPEIELRIPALLPADYLPDVHTRLVQYKRIAAADSDDELRALQVEMIDRFGLLPEAAKNLFAVTAFKLRAQALGIERITADEGGGRVVFNGRPNVEPALLVELTRQAPQTYGFVGANVFRFRAEMAEAGARLQTVSELLQRFGDERAA